MGVPGSYDWPKTPLNFKSREARALCVCETGLSCQEQCVVSFLYNYH